MSYQWNSQQSLYKLQLYQIYFITYRCRTFQLNLNVSIYVVHTYVIVGICKAFPALSPHDLFTGIYSTKTNLH